MEWKNKNRAWINYSVDALDLAMHWISAFEVMQGNFLHKSELMGADLLSAFDADPNEGGGKHGCGETHESASLFREARLVKYENHSWNVVKKTP